MEAELQRQEVEIKEAQRRHELEMKRGQVLKPLKKRTEQKLLNFPLS